MKNLLLDKKFFKNSNISKLEKFLSMSKNEMLWNIIKSTKNDVSLTIENVSSGDNFIKKSLN